MRRYPVELRKQQCQGGQHGVMFTHCAEFQPSQDDTRADTWTQANGRLPTGQANNVTFSSGQSLPLASRRGRRSVSGLPELASH